MVNGDYFHGVLQHLENIDHLFRTGKAPRPVSYYVKGALFSLLIGAAISGIILLNLRGRTKGLRPETNADRYLVRDSFVLVDSSDTFSYKTVSKTRRETETRSSGGGGGSSYSGGYSSSSGSSFSGGGRSF